jgi:predicted phage gp36 major capsid-like protein
MSRTTKTLGFSVPPAVVKEVEGLAKAERRTKSELFREMVRVYRRYRAQRDRDEEQWIMKLIEEVKAEEKRRPTPPEELARQEAELAAYGQKQAKKLGIKPRDMNRLVREHRAQNQS